MLKPDSVFEELSPEISLNAAGERKGSRCWGDKFICDFGSEGVKSKAYDWRFSMSYGLWYVGSMFEKRI